LSFFYKFDISKERVKMKPEIGIFALVIIAIVGTIIVVRTIPVKTVQPAPCVCVFNTTCTCTRPPPVAPMVYPRWLPPIKDRGQLAQMVQSLGYTGIGVEVGVLNGDYSDYFLTHWKSCSGWFAVDPWTYQKTYDDGANAEQKIQDERYHSVVRRLAKFPHAHVLRNYSDTAVRLFEDESIDFVYIDARHDYSSVLNDLRTWWPKIKVGGIVAGHDFLNSDECEQWRTQPDGTIDPYGRAVRAAVEDFTKSVHRQPSVCYRESAWNSWYFAK
jgi:hypothetical protein